MSWFGVCLLHYYWKLFATFLSIWSLHVTYLASYSMVGCSKMILQDWAACVLSLEVLVYFKLVYLFHQPLF